MSDHLPECECFGLSENAAWQTDCQCDRLRACEARVREVCDEHYRKNVNEAITVSYAAALDAAHDAVAAVEMGGEHFWSVGFRDGITNALAAIDALRGEA